MRKLLLVSILLCATRGWGAWTSIGTLGSANDKTAGTSIVLNPSATLNSGNVGVCSVAADNDGDGTANDVTSITDSGSNTWVEALEIERDPGAGAAGASAAIYYTVATSDVTLTTGNITANFAGSPAASAITCWEFSITGGNVVSLVGTGSATGSGTACTSYTITPSSGSREHLYIEGAAVETASTSYGGAWTIGFARNATSGGGDASNMSVNGEAKIETSTSATTAASWITSTDYACVGAALDEDAPAAASGQGWWGSGMGF